MDPLGNIEDVVDDLIDNFQVHKRNININHPSFKDLRPNFGWAPVDVIQKTFQCTTQWARSIERYPFRKHFKSRFPALNVPRRNEPVATDTVYSDTPAVDSGATIAQVFVGHKTLVTDVYPMKSDSDFVLTL